MADAQSSSSPATPAPTSIANWTYPRLPQPFDILEGMGGGGGGGASPSTSPPQMSGTASAGSVNLFSRGDHRHPSDTSRLAVSGGTMSGALTLSGPPTANLHAATKAYVDLLEARIAALEAGGGGPGLSAPSITSSLTASGQVGVAFSYSITASGNPAPTFNATNLPAGLTFSGSTISGTPTAAAPAPGHNITITATNSQGSDTKTLVLTIAPAAVSTPWQVTFEFSDNVENVNGLNIGGVGFPPNGRIPLVEWTGWQASYDPDMSNDLYNAANQAALPVQLYAHFAPYTAGTEAQVPFDNWAPYPPPSGNEVTQWGFANATRSINVTGLNATGAPIRLRLEKA